MVQKGSFVGIIGSNGAGKSTLVKAIANQVFFTGMIKKTDKVSVHLQDNAYPNTVGCQTILYCVKPSVELHNTKRWEYL
ncbi:ATP-binding cassette domain-containing protein [Enterococcus rotai]|uniref:ATP-binding cassette domain-containing protein n=1 Tax=Enterococcus rotai TaxID=118060 RepID=UPI0035C72C5E